MKVKYTINNYILGAKLKTTPIHKIIKQERIDSRHTLIVYNDVNEKEIQFINKVLTYKGTIIE